MINSITIEHELFTNEKRLIALIGIDRLAYIPKIGVVSGAFTFYLYPRFLYFYERIKKCYLEYIQLKHYERMVSQYANKI